MNVQLDCLGHLQGERLFEGRRRVPWIFVVIFFTYLYFRFYAIQFSTIINFHFLKLIVLQM